jgi:hypothetical protein
MNKMIISEFVCPPPYRIPQRNSCLDSFSKYVFAIIVYKDMRGLKAPLQKQFSLKCTNMNIMSNHLSHKKGPLHMLLEMQVLACFFFGMWYLTFNREKL